MHSIGFLFKGIIHSLYLSICVMFSGDKVLTYNYSNFLLLYGLGDGPTYLELHY
jgi:hypothetical protein